MPKAVVETFKTTYKPVTEIFEAGASAFEKTKDFFTPELPPPPETPAPVAQRSALAGAQAEERSLINRAGLATTKKVNYSLLKQKGRQSFGGTSV